MFEEICRQGIVPALVESGKFTAGLTFFFGSCAYFMVETFVNRRPIDGKHYLKSMLLAGVIMEAVNAAAILLSCQK